jgi:hypothetical protein
MGNPGACASGRNKQYHPAVHPCLFFRDNHSDHETSSTRAMKHARRAEVRHDQTDILYQSDREYNSAGSCPKIGSVGADMVAVGRFER